MTKSKLKKTRPLKDTKEIRSHLSGSALGVGCLVGTYCVCMTT